MGKRRVQKTILHAWPITTFDPDVDMGEDDGPAEPASPVETMAGAISVAASPNNPPFIDAIQFTDYVEAVMKQSGTSIDEAAKSLGPNGRLNVLTHPLNTFFASLPDNTFLGAHLTHDHSFAFPDDDNIEEALRRTREVLKRIIEVSELLVQRKAGNNFFNEVLAFSPYIITLLKFVLNAWECGDLQNPEISLAYGMTMRLSGAAVCYVELITCGGNEKERAMMDKVFRDQKGGDTNFTQVLSTVTDTATRALAAEALERVSRLEFEAARAHLLLAYLIEGLNDRGVPTPGHSAQPRVTVDLRNVL